MFVVHNGMYNNVTEISTVCMWENEINFRDNAGEMYYIKVMGVRGNFSKGDE